MFDLLKEKLSGFVQKISGSKEAPSQVQSQPESSRKVEAKVGLTSTIKGIVKGHIELNENEFKEFFNDFELALLEADVEVETAVKFTELLKKDLLGKKIPIAENVSTAMKQEIKKSLSNLMEVEPIELERKINSKKPFIILILGPNGAGKTTTIAKLTHYLQQKNKKIVWSSSDTFRSGAIEQLEQHAQKLKVRMIKHQYNSDPAAVAFDAVNAAKADEADVLIIDSAGRQNTNKNLLEELKKIVRVVVPDLKVYVGESFTGQSLLDQAKAFDEAIGLDGFILTKIDLDPKGGNILSIIYTFKKPILFLGTGQNYSDLQPFNSKEWIDKLVN